MKSQIVNKNSSSQRDVREHSFDFTIEDHGLIKLNKCIALNSIPGGFYEPIHFQNRYVTIKSLLDKMNDPSLTPERYFPLEEWHLGFKKMDEQISAFLKNQGYYYYRGLPYRRNMLLFGEGGTGKSTYIYQKCREFVEEHDAIIIKIDNFGRLKGLSRYLAEEMDVINDRLKVLVIEDVDQFRDDYARDELIYLLNRAELQNNTLLIMTSTLPNAIPNRIINSSSHIHDMTGVYNQNFKPGFVEAWFEFIVGERIPSEEYDQPWFNEVQGNLSPVFLKELFLGSLLNERSFQQGWEDLNARKEQLGDKFGKKRDLFEEEVDGVSEQDLSDLLEALEA